MEGFDFRAALLRGLVIPAHPLALDADRKLSERHQRALTRYYLAAGAGGVAVGVHTTQFEIRDRQHNLLEPVLRIAREELDRADHPVVRVGGICGKTPQAMQEAERLRDLGFHVGLVSLAAFPDASDTELYEHVRQVGKTIPVFGFYLQPAVGGRILSYSFWRKLCELDSLIAIKIAPFNRYQTLEVIRAIADSCRENIALYTGNDDNIVADLLTTYTFNSRPVRIVGGLLGQWAVGTKKAVDIHKQCQSLSDIALLLCVGTQITDCNAAIFDAANRFQGCIAGIHEVLYRQGLLPGIHCLNPRERLSPGQSEEIDRVKSLYPQHFDDAFIAQNLTDWLNG